MKYLKYGWHKIYAQYFSRISRRELLNVMRQLVTLLEVNIPLARALQQLSALPWRPAIKKLLHHVIDQLHQGMSFSQALRMRPENFSSFDCHLFAAGEQTATLAVAIQQWINYQTQLEQLTQRLRKALFYPTVVVVFSVLIVVALLKFIVPQFAQLFASVNAPLPLFTRGILMIAQQIRHYGAIILIGLGVIILVIILLRRYIATINYHCALWQLRLPWIGRWQRYSMMARMMRTLSLTVASSLPLLQGLALTQEIIGHPHYRQALLYIKNAVHKGETLANAFQHSGCFDWLVIQFISTGEQSGRLAAMLQKIAEWYDSQLDEAVTFLSQWLEPLLMMILGIIIGAIVLAMYLPIFQLGKVL